LSAQGGTAQDTRSDSSSSRPATAAGAENWSDPSITESHLKAEPAMLVEHAEFPAFTRDWIQIEWRAGDPIYLFLILPKGQSKPPVILYLYSYPSETDRFLSEAFCKFLAQRGFAAVGFVSALTGHRYHNRPMRQWFISELQESLGDSVHDVQMILNYLETRKDLDTAKVGMFGEGSGASIAIMATAVDPRIKAVDLVDPWGDWPDWLAHSPVVPEEERADYLKPEYLKKVAPLEPLRWLPGLKAAVRLQYLTEPSNTPLTVQKRMIAAAPAQTKIIPHQQAAAQYKTTKLKFFDWIKDQLQATSGSVNGTVK
jgi:hypothetical protein